MQVSVSTITVENKSKGPEATNDQRVVVELEGRGGVEGNVYPRGIR